MGSKSVHPVNPSPLIKLKSLSCPRKAVQPVTSFISAKPFEKSAKSLYLRPFLAEGVRGYWLKLRQKTSLDFGIGA